MSHSHSHAPGESHSHSHSHSPTTPLSPTGGAVPPPPDPALQALIEQDFRPVPLKLSDDRTKALCSPHKLEKCDKCDIDFVNLNRFATLLANNPNLLCPPPANMVNQRLTQLVTSTKDEGNVCPFLLFFWSVSGWLSSNVLFYSWLLLEPVQELKPRRRCQPVHRCRVSRGFSCSLGSKHLHARRALDRHFEPLRRLL